MWTAPRWRRSSRSNDNNVLLSFLNFFSGGGLSQMGVMALGVYPYITASIIMQLLQPIIPRLEALQQEGDAGRARINQYTLYLTIPLAFFRPLRKARCWPARQRRHGRASELGLHRR